MPDSLLREFPLWEQGLPAMEAARFTKDRIASIAGKPCSHSRAPTNKSPRHNSKTVWPSIASIANRHSPPRAPGPILGSFGFVQGIASWANVTPIFRPGNGAPTLTIIATPPTWCCT
ncbi:hypothetical protein DZG01_03895 [Pseudomonas fluorescens]|nr:hypothetical protein DZG01_03895 [Pseudomonas fluorescens]